MSTVYLVSCVKTKAGSACAAADLYRSQWFVAARSFVEARNAPWFVLSAKYGLIEPAEIIEPYEHTLNDAPVAERRQWARSVLDRLHDYLRAGDEVVFLAGQRYREFLEGPLRDRGIHVRVPMRSLRQGEQVSWLQRHRDDAA